MPEFPEVFTITRQLNDLLTDAEIKEVFIRGDYNVIPDNQTFINRVKNKKVTTVKQIAKNIIIKLEDGLAINIHLAMTGQVMVKKNNFPIRWERVGFILEKNSKELFIAFTDMRMFGKVRLLNKEKIKKLHDKYGPVPLDKDLTTDKLQEIIKSKNTSIKNLIMDQEKIGGLGNIYATEALFLAGIHPETRTGDIPEEKTADLLKAMQELLKEGIKNKGSTLEDEMYKDIYGRKGHQQEYFRIYNQNTCPKCQGEIKKKKIAGRNTYFCPTCQQEDFTPRLL